MVDEGVGPVLATPIMCWLAGVAGPVAQFNQTVVVQAPAGVSEAEVVVVLQAVLDRHAMLRLRVEDWGVGAPGSGYCGCPRRGRWMRHGACNRWRCYPRRR